MALGAIDILKQSLLEVGGSGYFTCRDRVLAMFDRARESLIPVKGRTVEQHTQLTEACRGAQMECAKTIEPEGEFTEESSYKLLSKLGQMPPERHKDLLVRTIARLE